MRPIKLGAVAVAGTFGAIFPFQIANASAATQVVNAYSSQAFPTNVKVELNVRQDGGPTAVADNLALATSVHCNGCRTIAISIEVDLVNGTPRATLGINHSRALDLWSQNSQTLADAVQFVVATGGYNLSLTSAGTDALNGILSSLQQEANSSTPVGDIQSQINSSVVPQIESILASDVTSSNPIQAPSVNEGGQEQEIG